MFIKNDYNKVLLSLEPRVNKIKNLTKVKLFDEDYKSFLSDYNEAEFTADIFIFNYERSINENYYIQKNYHHIAELVWMVGRSGQGDEWFIDKRTSNVLFYDHNLGEYQDRSNYVDLNIDFKNFVVLSDLFRQLELLLEDREVSESEKKEFVKQINSISSNLYEIYPYKYF